MNRLHCHHVYSIPGWRLKNFKLISCIMTSICGFKSTIICENCGVSFKRNYATSKSQHKWIIKSWKKMQPAGHKARKTFKFFIHGTHIKV